jgi:hypothetical protein
MASEKDNDFFEKTRRLDLSLLGNIAIGELNNGRACSSVMNLSTTCLVPIKYGMCDALTAKG